MTRKRYDRQFKLAAANLVLKGEIPTKQISEEHGVPDNTLKHWASEYGREGEAAFPGSGSTLTKRCLQIQFALVLLSMRYQHLMSGLLG